MYYSSKFGTNTNTNNQIANNKIKTILMGSFKYSIYSKSGSRGRRRAARKQIVKLMKALSIQASTITPSSSFRFKTITNIVRWFIKNTTQ